MPEAGTILIVDEDPSVAYAYATMLGLRGYEVLTALDGDAAWRAITASRPDAILLALHLPRRWRGSRRRTFVTAIELVRRLRAREGLPRTPVAVLTADHLVNESVSRQLRELDALMQSKPLRIGELFLLVRRLLASTH